MLLEVLDLVNSHLWYPFPVFGQAKRGEGRFPYELVVSTVCTNVRITTQGISGQARPSKSVEGNKKMTVYSGLMLMKQER
jgi:hypothetical protein